MNWLKIVFYIAFKCWLHSWRTMTWVQGNAMWLDVKGVRPQRGLFSLLLEIYWFFFFIYYICSRLLVLIICFLSFHYSRPYTPMKGAFSNVWFDRYKICNDVPEHIESIDSMCRSLTDLINDEIKSGIAKDRILIGKRFIYNVFILMVF